MKFGRPVTRQLAVDDLLLWIRLCLYEAEGENPSLGIAYKSLYILGGSRYLKNEGLAFIVVLVRQLLTNWGER